MTLAEIVAIVLVTILWFVMMAVTVGVGVRGQWHDVDPLEYVDASDWWLTLFCWWFVLPILLFVRWYAEFSLRERKARPLGGSLEQSLRTKPKIPNLWGAYLERQSNVR